MPGTARRRWRRATIVVATLLLVMSCSTAEEPTAVVSTTADTTIGSTGTTTTGLLDSTTVATPTITEPILLAGAVTVSVVAIHPHDRNAFTQGLEVVGNGLLVESTGLYGESDRRIVDVRTGDVVESVEIDAALFGEGITIVGDEVIQLTWREGVYLRADLDTLTETARGTYTGEGWGLCHDGARLVMSNGSSTLTFRDPVTFEPTGTVDVTLDGAPVSNLNELECVNGQVLANVWLSDLIVVIDPTTGDVVATLDGSPLRPEDLPSDDADFALNGIAHDPVTGHYFLTGKLWPVLYEVELS